MPNPTEATALATTNGPAGQSGSQLATQADMVARITFDEFRKHYLPGAATEAEAFLCFEVMRQTGLNPVLKQIYFLRRGTGEDDKLTPQTSIDGYRLIAERTGKRDGEDAAQWCGEDGVWRETWVSDKPPLAARVRVYKRGCAHPFFGIAHYGEYCGTRYDKQLRKHVPTKMWVKMPATMLAKCAEALAIRKAFPQETCGVYTSEEMEQAANQGRPDVREGTIVDEGDELSPDPVRDIETRQQPRRPSVWETEEYKDFAAACKAKGWDKQGMVLFAERTSERAFKDLAPADFADLIPKVEAHIELDLDGDVVEHETPPPEPTATDVPDKEKAARQKLSAAIFAIGPQKGLNEDILRWYGAEKHGFVRHETGVGSFSKSPLSALKALRDDLDGMVPDRARQVFDAWTLALDDARFDDDKPFPADTDPIA